MKNIEDLRAHLFETLAALKDKDQPMELERAKTIAGVAQVIVNTATAEVKFMNATGRAVSNSFFPEIPTPANQPRLVQGKAGGR